MMCRIGAIILRFAACALAACPAISQDTARLARARAFSKDALVALTRNASIVPNWIGGGERFWFKRQNPTGSDFYIGVIAFGIGLTERSLGDVLTQTGILAKLAPAKSPASPPAAEA